MVIRSPNVEHKSVHQLNEFFRCALICNDEHGDWDAHDAEAMMSILSFHCETVAKSWEAFHQVSIVLDGLDLMEHDVRRRYRW